MTGRGTETLLIGGVWQDGHGEAGQSVSPHSGETVWTGATSSAEDVADALAAARGWVDRRGDVAPGAMAAHLHAFAARLDDRAEALTDLVVREVGKPRREAREEVRRAAMIVRYYAGAPLAAEGRTIPSADGATSIETRREPLGVVGLVLPWNFPIAIPLWKLAPAIAYGNAVVLKPAPQATACAMAIAELAEGLPPGLVSVLPGHVAPVTALLDGELDGLSFTGSTASGRHVAGLALEQGIRFQGELGGKNASVVLADADLEHAATVVAWAAMGYAGQKCTATSRVIIEASVADRFLNVLAERVGALQVGDPSDIATDVGPLISADAVQRVDGFVRRAVAAGGRIVAGGAARPDLGPCYYAPTIIADVTPDSELAQTEVFGPVLAALVVDDVEAAIATANGTEYGLAAAVFTTSLRGLQAARRLRAGVIRINAATPGVDFNAPFPPDRASGIGLPELGDRAADFFTRDRTITVHVPA